MTVTEPPSTAVQVVKADAVKSLIDGTPLLSLLDVRPRATILKEGGIPKASYAPGGIFSSRFLPDALTTPILIVGNSSDDAGTAAVAARAAIEWGARSVSWVEGGYQAWHAAGLPSIASPLPLPSVKIIFEPVTGTCQFIVTDDETLDTIIIDGVLDFDPVKGEVTHGSADKVLAFVREHNLNVVRIIETHVHADHLTSAQYLKAQLGSRPLVCIGEGIRTVQATFKTKWDLSDLATDGSQFDELFADNATYSLGQLQCRVLSTPGHTSDSTSHLIGGAVFVGDTVFQPDSGTARCDFPGGSAAALYNSIQRIYSLPPFVQVFVGHDYQPGGRVLQYTSLVEEQIARNTHVQSATTLEEFVKVRTTRDATLGNPRLLYYAIQTNVLAGRLPKADSEGRRFFKVPIQSRDL